jgi:hypothetical protein
VGRRTEGTRNQEVGGIEAAPPKMLKLSLHDGGNREMSMVMAGRGVQRSIQSRCRREGETAQLPT